MGQYWKSYKNSLNSVSANGKHWKKVNQKVNKVSFFPSIFQSL